MRWLSYDGCSNFRDIGGYPAAGGRSVQWKHLYRSDTLSRLSRENAARVHADLGIRTIIDLRTPEEVDGAPWASSDSGWEVIAVPTDNPDPEALRRAGAAGIGDLYVWSLDQLRSGFPAILHVIASRDRLPCVIQCRSGKDRTGIVVALLLALLEVQDGSIVEDYALTEQALQRLRPKEVEQTKAQLAAAGLDPDIVHTRPETMRRFLAGLHAAADGAAAFAAAAGVGEDVIASVRTNLLTPSA